MLLICVFTEDVRAMEYCVDYDGSKVERGKLFSMGVNPCVTCTCGPDGKPIECDEMKCHVPPLPVSEIFDSDCVSCVEDRFGFATV